MRIHTWPRAAVVCAVGRLTELYFRSLRPRAHGRAESDGARPGPPRQKALFGLSVPGPPTRTWRPIWELCKSLSCGLKLVSYQIIYARASSLQRPFEAEVCSGQVRIALNIQFMAYTWLLSVPPVPTFAMSFLRRRFSVFSCLFTNLAWASTLLVCPPAVFFVSSVWFWALFKLLLGTSWAFTPCRSAQTKTMEAGRETPPGGLSNSRP